MAKLLGQSKEPVVIAAIGPLTNIAHLLLIANDQIKAKIKEVVVVMGRSPGLEFTIGKGDKKVGGIRDFNVTKDPEAVRVVMDSGVPVTFAPFELSVQAVITPELLETIRDQHKTPAAHEIYQQSKEWMNYWMKALNDDGFHPWDSAAITYLSHPEYLQCEARSYRFTAIDFESRSEDIKKRDKQRDSIENSMLELANETQIKKLQSAGDKTLFKKGPYRFCFDFQTNQKEAFVKKIIQDVY